MPPPPAHALGTELTIRNAAEVRARLAPLVEAGGPVVLDAGGLERVDTAGLQLLCAFVQSLAAAGHGVSWKAASPALANAATALGLAGPLHLGSPR